MVECRNWMWEKWSGSKKDGKNKETNVGDEEARLHHSVNMGVGSKV